ncbi:coiled-coil domain-containing protein 116 isoform X1 [Lynx canadensis]|uniref:coiled-coil domain-containing protein 116 isoform X1 n=1 Tax=Lynx canadensis TaxID=61383 RepID=UPI0013C488E2|nr:coiled-coil domain-containing protein 116 isoform X1 [Lynx canadensis]
MTSCRHHSGYLADDEAGHTTYVARKGLDQSCFQRDSLLWDSLDSHASSQWTREPPLSSFSGQLGSSSGTPQTSELGPGEQELICLKQEFNKEIKSLLSQPASFDLPGYCSFREPHRTLDFLAEHQLFPALQNVVSQAVDKLRGARRHDGCPLFPSEWEPATEPNSDSMPGSKLATPTDEEEPYDMLPTRTSSPKMARRKSTKGRGQAKPKEGGSPMSSAQVATRVRLKSPSYNLMKKKPLPSISSKSTISHLSNPLYQELINYLVEQAVSLLICKYKFEKNLSKQLGFISFPVTETLVDLLLGFKKVKGSHICLSSKINWSCLLRKLEEAEWARQLSRQGSQHDSHCGTAHRSTAHQEAPWSNTESPSTLPEPSTQKNQEEDTEPTLHSELLDPQLLPAQEDTTLEEKEPKSQEEPRPFMFTGTDRGSDLCQEVVDMDSQGDEEEEDEDKNDDFFGDKGKPQSSPESQVEADVSLDSRDVGHSHAP